MNPPGSPDTTSRRARRFLCMVEVFNNQDDGFEFFGGTANARYLVSAFTTDDSFDLDQGSRGAGPFGLAVQNSVYADHAGEHDGGESSYGGECVGRWCVGR